MFTITIGIICLLVGLLFGALIERHMESVAAERQRDAERSWERTDG